MPGTLFRLASAVVALLLWASAATGQRSGADRGPASADAVFSEIDDMLLDLERITGWKAKRKVRAEWISRERVRTFLESRIRREVKPKDIRTEQTLLRMLGFVPDGFDIAQSTVDLVTEQAAAFYDYEHRRLYVLDTDESLMERRTTLVHELAHALADQHFSLRRFLRDGKITDDAATARQAVVEGQATWLMWAWQSERTGGRLEVPESATRADSGSANFPVFSSVPLYLRESLTFPYNTGLIFHDYQYERLGKQSFSRTFRTPPQSTQQILHPQLYEEGRRPAEIELPEVDGKVRTLADGTLGELDLQILLSQYCSPKIAEESAPDWRGGVFRLDEHKSTRRPVLTFAIATAGDQQATRLLELYEQVLSKKWKEINVTSRSANRLKGQGEFGPFETWTAGSTLYTMEGGFPRKADSK